MKYGNYQEYLKHPVFLAIRKTVMQEAKHKCQCGQPATEVHHLEYPPWGTFDTPSNMIAVCHQCHCEIETQKKGKKCK